MNPKLVASLMDSVAQAALHNADSGVSVNVVLQIIIVLGGALMLLIFRNMNKRIESVKTTSVNSITELETRHITATASKELLAEEKQKAMQKEIEDNETEIREMKDSIIANHRKDMEKTRNEISDMIKSVVTSADHNNDINRLDSELTEIKKEIGSMKKDFVSEVRFKDFQKNVQYVQDRRVIQD